MYTVKKNRPFYSSLRTLRFFLVYCEYVQESTYMVSTLISRVMTFAAFSVFDCGCILHAVMSVREHIGSDISEDLSISLGGLGMIVNSGLFKYHQKKWSNFFEDVTNFDVFGKPTEFDRVKDRGNLFSTLYMIYCTVGTIIYSCVGVVESSCDDLSEETRHKSICGTLAPIWLPFEDVSLTTRNMILLGQYVLANYIITPSAVICFLPFETTELLICHIRYLKDKLLLVFESEDVEVMTNRLRFCVEYHKHILRMAEQLKFVVKFSVGHMSLICALVFGCIGNQIFKVREWKKVLIEVFYIENNGTDVSEGLSITLGCLGTLSNASMFHYHLKKWTTLFNQVTDFRKFGKPANFEKVQDRGNFFCIFYVVTCSFGAILYSIVTLFQTMCHDENLEQICGTMLPIWIPFENISPIIVKLIFTIQFILINAVVTPAAVISFFSFETTELIISHINHLKILFSDVFEDIDENIRYERLRFCIEYHIRILDMAKQLDYLVKYTMGQMSIISPLIFACLGNQIFITKPLAAGIFLMGYLISMFMQCYAGQRMTDEDTTWSAIHVENLRFRMPFIKTLVVCRWAKGIVMEVSQLPAADSENNGTDVSEGLSIALGCLGTLSNTSMFHYHSKKWARLFNQVTDFRKFGKPSDFEKTQDRGNSFCIFYIVICSFGVVLYSTVAIFQTTCNDENPDRICGTMLPIWLPFKNIPPLMVKLIFTIQFTLMYAIVTSSAVISLFPFEITELIISHMNHLKIFFSDVFEDIDEDIRCERLRFCIQYHNRILEMAKQLDHLVKYTMGHMSIISPLIFACLGNQVFKTKPLAAGIFLMGYLISIFMLCYAGQRMTDGKSFVSNMEAQQVNILPDPPYVYFLSAFEKLREDTEEETNPRKKEVLSEISFLSETNLLEVRDASLFRLGDDFVKLSLFEEALSDHIRKILVVRSQSVPQKWIEKGRVLSTQ
ncbi:hypothetical protein JTB14_031881 [Gonioctena quinquepunctata]|nr:hypothetical protein JTB14_031881 [Gonioctena quinquepunctata]